MKITKTTFSYDFETLKKELSSFTNNDYALNELISFLKKTFFMVLFPLKTFLNKIHMIWQ